MATIVRGKEKDSVVEKLKDALDKYEADHPGARADLYRYNSASIRVRVIDRRFEGMAKSRCHDEVWNYLAGQVSDDDALAEVSQLLTIAPAEVQKSFANLEFEDPQPSLS